MQDLGPIIQQALDAIEYANGPVNSKWGAVRAKMGHPAPFNLKYIEIGNEHNTPLYGEYYVKFREAIKAKYPGHDRHHDDVLERREPAGDPAGGRCEHRHDR